MHFSLVVASLLIPRVTLHREQNIEMGDVSILSWYFNEVTKPPSVLWRCWLGSRKGIRPVNLSGGMLAWLSVRGEVQICIWPSQCHCHSLSLASVKSNDFSNHFTSESWLAGSPLFLHLSRTKPQDGTSFNTLDAPPVTHPTNCIKAVNTRKPS